MVGGKNKLSSIFYSCITYFVGEITFCTFNCTDKTIPILLSSAPNYFVYAASLKDLEGRDGRKCMLTCLIYDTLRLSITCSFQNGQFVPLLSLYW